MENLKGQSSILFGLNHIIEFHNIIIRFWDDASVEMHCDIRPVMVMASS